MTDFQGARLLIQDSLNESIKIFGDSQVLALDISDKEDHYLNKVYPNMNFQIFAAPNNGPYEVLNSIELNSFDHEHIVVTFNSSTDLFRISNDWYFYDHVLFDIDEVNLLTNFPLVYDFIKLINFYTKERSFKLLNNETMQTLFLDYNNNEIYKNFKNYFNKFNLLLIEKNLTYDYYFTHPYWIYNLNGDELIVNMSVYDKYIELVDLIASEFPNVNFSNILNANINRESLTNDKRHLRSNNYRFQFLN